MKKLARNLKLSLHGIRLALYEFSFRAEILWVALVIGLMFQINATPIEKIIGIVLSIFLLAIEMLNTSIEIVCNKITYDHDILIKNAKDVASGSVFIVVLVNIFYMGYLLSVNGLHSGSFLKKLIG